MRSSLIKLGMVVIAVLAITLTANGSEVTPLDLRKVVEGAFVAQGAVKTSNAKNQGHIANLGFIIGSKYVAVIDTGGSYQTGLRLRAAIRTITQLPIKFVISTHMHPDHVLGNAAFLQNDKAMFVGHAKLKSALSSRAETYLTANRELIGKEGFAGTQIVMPTKPVAAAEKIDLGDRVLQIIPVKTAHTDNDLMIIDQKTRSAWLGDLVFSNHLPVIDGNLNGWLELMNDLMQQEFDFVVMGHGDVPGKWPDSAVPQLEYLSDLRGKVRSFIADGKSLSTALEHIPPHGIGTWQLTEEYHRRNVSAAFAELEWE